MFCSFKSSLICKTDQQLYSKLLKPPFSHLFSVAPQDEQGLTMTEARVKLFRSQHHGGKGKKKGRRGSGKTKIITRTFVALSKACQVCSHGFTMIFFYYRNTAMS